MNIRKLLCNSSKEFWHTLNLPLLLGICVVIPSPILIVMIMPNLILAALGAILAIVFIISYMRLVIFVINMGSLYGRPCLFKEGDIVTHGLEPYIVTIADSQHMWVSSDLENKTNAWITDCDNWTFYKSTWFERLLQNDNFC